MPITTVLKARLVGFAASRPGGIPVPSMLMVRVPLAASLAMDIVPDDAPAELGLNIMLKVVLCPAGRETGSVGLLSVNCFELEVAPVMVSEPFPVLVALTV